MAVRSIVFSLIAVLFAGDALAAKGLPMFAPGKVSYVFEYELTINGQVINRAGKAVAPMGYPQTGSVCFTDPGSLLGMSGFMPGINGAVKPSGQKDRCTYSDLKVNGNTASFAASCSSGSASVPDTVGKVTHVFDPATQKVTQKFTGSSPYGKSVQETHVFQRVGACT